MFRLLFTVLILIFGFQVDSTDKRKLSGRLRKKEYCLSR